jgi:hypothetical protein
MVEATPLENHLRRCLTPPGVFLGILIGFVCCCVAGRKSATRTTFHDFQRFHRAINPQSHYYPTALQVRTLARRQLPRDRIAVVVGGSSIMLGFGQAPEELWTKELERQLGADYRVLNLAMPGGAPNEIGQLAAEMLLRDHPRLIYVCNCGLKRFALSPDGTQPVYRYFYHDARARDLLAPLPERDAALHELESARRAHEKFDELSLQSHANACLSFNDLWHVLGYEVVFTVWNSRTALQPWRARKKQPFQQATFVRYGGNPKEQMDIIVDETNPNDPEQWAAFERVVRQSSPAELRARTLITVNRFSPYYLKLMEAGAPDIQARLNAKVENTMAHLQACGITAVDGFAGLTPDDYLDRHHLSAEGGRKLACALAPAIRALAQRRGFETGDQP